MWQETENENAESILGSVQDLTDYNNNCMTILSNFDTS